MILMNPTEEMPTMHSRPFIFENARAERVSSDLGHGSSLIRDVLKNRLAEITRQIEQKESAKIMSILRLLKQLESTDQNTVLAAVKHVYEVALVSDALDCEQMFDALTEVSMSTNTEAVLIALRALSLISERKNRAAMEGLRRTIEKLESETAELENPS